MYTKFFQKINIDGYVISRTLSLSANRCVGNGILEIYTDREIKTSNVVNLIMAGMSFTGIGAIVAGAYAVIDVGFIVITGGTSFGDVLDQKFGIPIIIHNEIFRYF